MVHSYTDGWSQVSQVRMQNGIKRHLRDWSCFSSLVTLNTLTHLPFFFFEAHGFLVPQPLTEPVPLAVEAPSLDHEPPGKSQLALF